ncbi:hypothetical protein J3459_008326 [Metarhizium acridum]|nr:hypothetical protein J3459_008326 [Metarhizium acridum]
MTQAVTTTPHRLAEWARHAGTAKKDISATVDAVALFEPVIFFVELSQVSEAEEKIKRSDNKGHVVPIKGYKNLDLWMRDMAPTLVLDREDGASLAGVDFNVGCIHHLQPYKGVPRDFFHHHRRRLSRGRRQGTLLATRSSILNDNRNRGTSPAEVEQELCRTLGVKKIMHLELSL